MALFNDTFCQICDRFITKERWNKLLYSSRHLHREVNGFWPAFFPQRKLTRDEGMKLEKTFWEMIFGSVDVLPLYRFLKTYFMMVTNMKNYVTLDSDGDDADFRYDYRDIMIAQFKQDSNNKNFSLRDQDKRDNSLQKGTNFGSIKFLLTRVHQYQILNMIMNIMMMGSLISFKEQRTILNLEN